MGKDKLDRTVWDNNEGDYGVVEVLDNGNYYIPFDKHDVEFKTEKEMSNYLKDNNYEYVGIE